MSFPKNITIDIPEDFDFEYYGNDIRYADMGSIDDLVDDISRETLAEELKMCCTNVMLQCLDPESRCIFIFGTMFKLDSHTAGEILDLTPENYRKKLSRIRKKVSVPAAGGSIMPFLRGGSTRKN